MSCNHGHDYPSKVSPNFNPGVRQWYNVTPEKHKVSGMGVSMAPHDPPTIPAETRVQPWSHKQPFVYGLDNPYWAWVPPLDMVDKCKAQRVEGFAHHNVTCNNVMYVLLIVAIIYFVYNFLNKKR